MWGPVIPVMEQSTFDLDIYERYNFLLMEDLCSNTSEMTEFLKGHNDISFLLT